jgi:hypothetical protein
MARYKYRKRATRSSEAITVIISLALVVLLIIAVGLLTRFSPQSEAAVASYGSDASFVDNFSLRTYRPMLRLASQIDKEFLAEAHGKALACCYRKIQRDLLREYLKEAQKDFNQMYAIATRKAVQAVSDQGDLSIALLEQQMSFLFSIWALEIRLLVDDYLPFNVDLAPMVAHLEGLANQTRALVRPQYSYSAL